MIAPMKMLSALFCLTLVLPCMSQAETYGLPQIHEQQFSLTDTGQIATEVISGEILSKVDSHFTGTIKLSWADDEYASTAQELRSMLIEGGVAPDRILVEHASGGFTSNAVSGIKIIIQEIIMRLPECNYRSQGYSFDYHDEMGCAINNTRSSSIINPYNQNY
ncbi:hypothetical protein MAQ58_13890 [Enterobacter sp. DRP3]|nr:hypothetical protein [Enterobacter sp. DRP3]